MCLDQLLQNHRARGRRRRKEDFFSFFFSLQIPGSSPPNLTNQTGEEGLQKAAFLISDLEDSQILPSFKTQRSEDASPHPPLPLIHSVLSRPQATHILTQIMEGPGPSTFSGKSRRWCVSPEVEWGNLMGMKAEAVGPVGAPDPPLQSPVAGWTQRCQIFCILRTLGN